MQKNSSTVIMVQKSTEYLNWLKKYLEETYQKPNLENFLNLQILNIEKGKVTYSCTIKDLQTNIYGFVHGGTLASICDVAMGVSCITLDKLVVTIDMSISFIKNVTAGNTLIAKGKVISSGKTIMRAIGEIYHNEQLLVRSQASYFVKGDFQVQSSLI
jgi:acyl-CoA thioesterase